MPEAMIKVLACLALVVGCRHDTKHDDPPSNSSSTSDDVNAALKVIDVGREAVAKGMPILLAHEKERDAKITVARAQLETLIATTDKLIADHDYERAMLEASKIRWPFHEGMKDMDYDKDYKELRQARELVITPHLPSH